jgi:hypothetical protein
MNVYGRITAAAGSLALNVALSLLLSQGAGAAVPAASESVQQPHSYSDAVQSPRSYTISVGSDHHPPKEQCPGGMRDRAILAVLLALIV